MQITKIYFASSVLLVVVANTVRRIAANIAKLPELLRKPA
jgi:hypothetical protein